MAQLKYTKVVACGTVAAVAGLSLAGIYMYKRRGSKKADQKKSAAKALGSDEKQTRRKRLENQNESEACNDCKDIEEKVENVDSNLSTTPNCNTGLSANSTKPIIEEPCIQVSTTTLETAPPPRQPIVVEPCIQIATSSLESAPPSNLPRPDLIAEDPCIVASSVSNTETTPPPLIGSSGDQQVVVEEACMQSSTPVLQNGYGDGLTNGDLADMDGQQPLSFDWASSVEAAEKEMTPVSLASPTCSTHNGSVAGSDLGSEANSDSSSFDSGRGSGGSTTSNPPAPTEPDEPIKYMLEFPSRLCGKLIGKMGRNIKQLKDKTKASVLLKEHPYLEETHLVIIEGSQTEIDAAIKYIKDRFSQVDVSKQFTPPVIEAPPVPEMSQLPLPEEIVNDVYISSVVSAAHVFVQQPTHPTFMALQNLDACMAQTYQQGSTVPPLPRPIEAGTICAAPMMQGWYRAQVVEVYSELDECTIKFLDYGGYAKIECGALRQIRSDFMTLPFQAVEGYLINLMPLPGETEFSETARVFVEHISQNFSSLHAKVKGYSQDGVSLIELYYTDNEQKVHSLNKELVNQGMVSWYESYPEQEAAGTEAVGADGYPEAQVIVAQPSVVEGFEPPAADQLVEAQ